MMADTPIISQSAHVYRARLGEYCCPFCRLSGDFTGGQVTIDRNIASQKMGCNECDEEWTDQYTLTGYVPSE